jgi:membrane protease YdiL (CAAX protease family)
MTDSAAVPGRRFGFLLWGTGMLGVAVVTATALPRFLGNTPLPAPLGLILLASLAQSGMILALAVWAGVALAPAVGLRAPAFQAVASGRPPWPALGPQLVPGLVAGVLGGLSLFLAGRNAPAAIAAAQEQFALPLAARLLYGGITEELLLRWGLLTALAWLAWRFLQHRRGAVRTGVFWLANAVSALLFAAGHLPAAAVLVGALDVDMVGFVIAVNAALGLLFGFLYGRFGLESAMLAHALAHGVNYLLNPT